MMTSEWYLDLLDRTIACSLIALSFWRRRPRIFPQRFQAPSGPFPVLPTTCDAMMQMIPAGMTTMAIPMPVPQAMVVPQGAMVQMVPQQGVCQMPMGLQVLVPVTMVGVAMSNGPASTTSTSVPSDTGSEGRGLGMVIPLNARQ
eukprot:Skav211488  [mRNA]  locus=scaffold2188:407139:407570:- [translate_table: standard]